MIKVVGYDGEPFYDFDNIGYQLQVSNIPNDIDLKEIIEEESKLKEPYYPDMWFVRGGYDRETKQFTFDDTLIYIGGWEYFFDYKFSDVEVLEMIKVCIENTNFNKVKETEYED